MERDEMPQVIDGQLSIDVPSSPKAIGRWTGDDEFREYANQKGVDRALDQKKRAEETRECNCGAQAKEDEEARKEERRSKKVSSSTHKAGCPQLRARSNTRPRISGDEQIRRYTSSV